MKKLCLLPIAGLFIALGLSTQAAYAGQSARQTATHIKTEADFQNMQSSHGNFVLDNDITFTTAFSPIDHFSGTLDGQGHTLKRVMIQKADSQSAQGLFGVVDHGVTIKNLKINGMAINGAAEGTAALIGKAGTDNVQNPVLIDNVSVKNFTSNVDGDMGNGLGGLIGLAQKGPVIIQRSSVGSFKDLNRDQSSDGFFQGGSYEETGGFVGKVLTNATLSIKDSYVNVNFFRNNPTGYGLQGYVVGAVEINQVVGVPQIDIDRMYVSGKLSYGYSWTEHIVPTGALIGGLRNTLKPVNPLPINFAIKDSFIDHDYLGGAGLKLPLISGAYKYTLTPGATLSVTEAPTSEMEDGSALYHAAGWSDQVWNFDLTGVYPSLK